MKNKGFSLVELIIVIAIMAIMVGILAPNLVKWVKKSRDAKSIQECQSCVHVVETLIADETYTPEKLESPSDAVKSKIVETAQVKGTVISLHMSEHHVYTMEYKSSSGSIVTYKADRDPLYQVEGKLGAQTNQSLDSMLGSVTGTSWKEVVKGLQKNNPDFTFPPVEDDIKDRYCEHWGEKGKVIYDLNLTWKPMHLKDGSYIMIASRAVSAEKRTDQSALEGTAPYSGIAYLIYDGSNYYVHDNGYDHPDGIYINGEQEGLTDILGVGKHWTKL